MLEFVAQGAQIMGRVPADLDADYHQIMTIWCKWE
jgi:hypothetical protein